MKPVIIIRAETHPEGEGVVNDKVYTQSATLKQDLVEMGILVPTRKDECELEDLIDTANSGDFVYLDYSTYHLLVLRLV